MESDPRAGSARVVSWLAVLAANLPVCGFFGLMVCSKGGMFGMCLGVGFFAGVGSVLAKRFGGLGRALTYGGVLVALSQFWPILQISCGAFALEIWSGGPAGRAKDNLGDSAIMKEAGGFVVTLLTGQPLILLALVLGGLLRGIRHALNRDRLSTADDSP